MTTLELENIKALDEPTNSVFRVVGTTKWRAKAVLDLDGRKGLAIPTSFIKIAPLEAMGEAMRSSLSVAAELPRENFKLASYVFVNDDHFCYPIIDLKSVKPVCCKLTCSVIYKFLECVTRRDEASKNLFPSEFLMLSEQAEAVIKAGAKEMLTGYGGNSITTPAKIYIEGSTIAAEFKGMFAGKPDLSVLEPVLLKFEGCVDGYRAKKREIFFDTKDESLLVFWENENQVIGNLSLAQKSDVLILEVSRTFDQRGRPIDSLVKISKK